jgi:hypothetical protein
MVGIAGTASAATVGGFSYGQLQAATVGASGCGTNAAGEPRFMYRAPTTSSWALRTAWAAGAKLWRGLGQVGGTGASACALEYRGQPNAVGGVGASGGDIDLAIANARNAAGNYNVYVSSLDDFGVDTDSNGFAHIALSHDSPDLGGSGTYTGSAVQISRATVGQPNN